MLRILRPPGTGVNINATNTQTTSTNINATNTQAIGANINATNAQATGANINATNTQATGVNINAMNTQSTGANWKSIMQPRWLTEVTVNYASQIHSIVSYHRVSLPIFSSRVNGCCQVGRATSVVQDGRGWRTVSQRNLLRIRLLGTSGRLEQCFQSISHSYFSCVNKLKWIEVAYYVSFNSILLWTLFSFFF